MKRELSAIKEQVSSPNTTMVSNCQTLTQAVGSNATPIPLRDVQAAWTPPKFTSWLDESCKLSASQVFRVHSQRLTLEISVWTLFICEWMIGRLGMLFISKCIDAAFQKAVYLWKLFLLWELFLCECCFSVKTMTAMTTSWSQSFLWGDRMRRVMPAESRMSLLMGIVCLCVRMCFSVRWSRWWCG